MEVLFEGGKIGNIIITSDKKLKKSLKIRITNKYELIFLLKKIVKELRRQRSIYKYQTYNK